MLFGFVMVYWVLSVALGLWAALRVKTATDFALAGKALPFHIVTATVFATWFGSETVLGIPAQFLASGMKGIVADPFGASLCLVLVGLFFARPLYRMKLLTIGDFYRQRYGRTAEIMTTFCIVISYLGWVAAQIKALGLVFHVISHGDITQQTGMLIGAGSILIYTLFGGMWSVAVTDFVQMIVIVLGMLYIGYEVGGQAGGVTNVLAQAQVDGKLNLLPSFNWVEMMAFAAALITMMLGSIPQQDVFQRVASAKNEHIAAKASILGGVLYFIFAFVPIFLVYCAVIIAPDLVKYHIHRDPQLILPEFIMQHAPLFAQIVFFGALLSAIKSCASATLLAPSVTFAENILRPMIPHLSQKRLLRLMQVVVLLFAAFVTMFALNSSQSIFEMVESAYSVTLVSSFIPLVCGLFWKKANTSGGLLAIMLGLFTWVCSSIWFSDATIPPQIAGLLASAIGMVLGTYLGYIIHRNPNDVDAKHVATIDHAPSLRQQNALPIAKHTTQAEQMPASAHTAPHIHRPKARTPKQEAPVVDEKDLAQVKPKTQKAVQPSTEENH